MIAEKYIYITKRPPKRLTGWLVLKVILFCLLPAGLFGWFLGHYSPTEIWQAISGFFRRLL